MEPTRLALRLAPVSLFCAASLAWACGDDEGKKPSDEKPLLGMLELPVSLRTTDPAPGEGHDIQVSPTQMRVNGVDVAPLTSGKLEGEAAGKLQEALRSPAHKQAAVQFHAQVPYASAVAILGALHDAGVSDISLKVRKSSGTETGWLALRGFTVGAKTAPEEDVTMAGVTPHSWADFEAIWEPVYEACGGSDSGNCAYKPEKIAQGGQLKMELYAAGQGVNVNFYRTGAPPPEEPESAATGKPAKAPEPADPAAELENAPPATQASFQFRAKEAAKQPSAISATTAPLCGKKACGVVVRADPATMVVRVVSLLGAAFPDDAAAPVVHFERP